MSTLLPFVIVGLVTGSIYALAGVGLVLTYRTSGVFNLGHGAIAAGAAFFFYTLHVNHHMAWPVAALITVVLFGLAVGSALDLVTRGMSDAAPIAVVALSAGLILAVEGTLYLIYGDQTYSFPTFLPQSGFRIDNVFITWDKVISSSMAVTLTAGLYAFLRLSRLGIGMRGVVDNATLTTLTGVSPERVRRTAWMIGSAFAAVSGILLAPTVGRDANLLTLLVVQALGACAIGMFSSLPMTYLGGLVVGLLASFATHYFTTQPWSGIPPATPFLVLIAVLLGAPRGRLPGRPVVRRIASSAVMRDRRSVAIAGLVGAGVLVGIPFVVGTHLPVWIGALTYAVLFASLGLLVWTSGQLSLCHMAFACLGATTLSHAQSHHVPWLLALLLGGLAAVPAGALIALPTLRLSGIYLALVTLGFGILMQDVVFPSSLMFGKQPSISASRPRLGGLDTAHDRTLYYLVLAIAVVSCGSIVLAARGQLGRVLRAAAESPTMLTTQGLSLSVTRLIVFCASAFFAGIAGGLLITQYSAVSGQSYGPVSSLLLVAVLAVSGTRLVGSAVRSALLLAVLPSYWTGFGLDQQTLVFGVAAVVAGVVLARRDELERWVRRSGAQARVRRVASPVRMRFEPRAVRRDMDEPPAPGLSGFAAVARAAPGGSGS